MQLSGLAAAFNAPLAGIMFVVEEMRPQFRYSLISIRAVIISAIMANIVFRAINGQEAVITMPQYQSPELQSLWLFLLLGSLFGVFGVIFNKLITIAQDSFVALHKNDRKRYLITGTILGGVFGLLLLYVPQLIQRRYWFDSRHYQRQLLNFYFSYAVRWSCDHYPTLFWFWGTYGGIFAPMLALGTLFGYAFGASADMLLPSLTIEP
ncbi:chloride channel protein [Vibrio harveyi]|nr:chloride channel protein [Vibrio harveyi]